MQPKIQYIIFEAGRIVVHSWGSKGEGLPLFCLSWLLAELVLNVSHFVQDKLRQGAQDEAVFLGPHGYPEIVNNKLQET